MEPAIVEQNQTKLRSVVSAIWNGLSTGISILVVAVAALVIAVPAAAGGMPLTVLSGSMRPSYEPGDLVVIRPKDPREIGVGEVITYQVRSGESELITHRVTEKSSATDGSVSFITQGDANDVPDATPIRDVQIHGTVWYRIPLLGWVNDWFTGDTRRIVVPAVAGILLLYALWNVVSGVRERGRERGVAKQGGQGQHTAA